MLRVRGPDLYSFPSSQSQTEVSELFAKKNLEMTVDTIMAAMCSEVVASSFTAAVACKES